MINRAIVFRSALSLVVYLALAAGTVVAQDPPRTELGIRLAENHGDGAFYRLEEVKLRQTPAYPAGTLYALKTCLLYTSPSPRDGLLSRMPSSA